MKKKTKSQIESELNTLKGIALALYRCVENNPETPASKRAMDDFVKYVMEKI